MDIRRAPGTVLANTSTGEQIYSPPVGEVLLREKLKNSGEVELVYDKSYRKSG